MDSEILGYEVRGDLHKFTIGHADLTEATADTAQTIELMNVDEGDIVQECWVNLATPFEDESDAAFNDIAITVGDGDDPDRYLASAQTAEPGTEITRLAGTGTKFVYTAADTVDLVVNSMTAKSLSNVDAGSLEIFVRVQKTANL